MKQTGNYGLKKPDRTDPVDINDINYNSDIIDTELKKKLESNSKASDMTTEFSQAPSRINLVSGETVKTSLGKIMRFFADLKSVAFTGSYNDLTNKPSIGGAASLAVANNDTTTAAGYVADARIVKTHGDEIDVLCKDVTATGNKVDAVTASLGDQVRITVSGTTCTITRV